MKKVRADLVGMKFGMLKVVSFSHIDNNRSVWNVDCECGKSKKVRNGDLQKIKSCGCYSISNLKKRTTTHGKANKTPEYRAWGNIKTRCLNENSDRYNDYGGRGIKICDRWKDSFENFLLDMGERPSASHSIERVKNDGNYEPSNCKWASKIEQANNKRNNKFVLDMETGVFYSSVNEAAELNNIHAQTIYWRNKNKTKNKLLIVWTNTN